MDLVKLIADQVQPYEKPAVYISGGLDSSIVLHHLREKLPTTKIYTYTAQFYTSADELEKASRVAEHYKTVHKIVLINDFIETLPHIQRIFDKPRFNTWPWWLARQAKKDGRKTIYIGECSDEIFGGYTDRDYLEGWAGQLIYVYPTYKAIHEHYNLDLETPFLHLPWTSLMNLHEPPNKMFLRSAYKNVLPDFVIKTRGQAPGFCNYTEFLNMQFRSDKPWTNAETKKELQKIVTKIWLEVQDESN